MSLAKRAQYWEDEPTSDEIFAAEDGEDEIEADIDVEEQEPEESVLLQIGDPEPVITEFSLTLPLVPGSDIEKDDLNELSVEEPEDEVKVEERDMWDYGPISNLLNWVENIFKKIPRHNGYDVSGLERAISFLVNIEKVISKAVRSDLKDELDIAKVEKARTEIRDGIDRLIERRDRIENGRKKTKKKSEADNILVKEAQKITGVGKIVITVPLIISRAARVCINGVVSAGHDLGDMYDRQVKQYKFDTIQQAELLQLLEDMGYPLKRDRGFLPDDKIDPSSSDNFDWNAQYYA